MTTRKHPHEPTAGQDEEKADENQTRRAGHSDMPETQKRLQEKIAELESALAEARDRHLRLAADFDNFKKRSRQEHLDTIQHAAAELISRLLPGIDDLHSALDNKPEHVEEAWVRGLELTVRKLDDALAAHGLEPIESVGARFDPKFHEAIGHMESSEQPEDTVVSELRRGYRMRDRVLRPALVRVSRRPAVAAPDHDAGE